MLYGLAKARPKWIPEVVAHWLRRRMVLIQQQKDGNGRIPWSDLFNHDKFGREHIQESDLGKITDATIRDEAAKRAGK